MKEVIFIDEVAVGSPKYLETLFETFSKTLRESSPKSVVVTKIHDNFYIGDFK